MIICWALLCMFHTFKSFTLFAIYRMTEYHELYDSEHSLCVINSRLMHEYKGKGKGRYLGRFRHCSRVDLLYPCPPWSSLIHLQRRHIPRRHERPLLAKEVTIQEFG
jgi:hypothetical protein